MKMSPVVVRKFAKRKLLWVLTLVVVVFSVNVSASEEITTPSETETQTDSLTTQNPADKRSDNEGDTLEHRMLGDDINISLELPESHRLVVNGEVSPSGRSGGGKGPDPTEASAKAEESKPSPTFTRWKYKPSFRHGGGRKPKTHDKDMKSSSSNKIDVVETERSDYPDDFFGPHPAPNGIGKKHEESKLTPANDRAYGKFGRLWKKRPFIPLVKQTTIVRPLHDHGHDHGHGHSHGRGWGWRRQRHGRRHHGRGRHPRFRHQRPKRLRHGKRPLHHHGHGHGHGWGHRTKHVQHGGGKYQGWESNDIEHHSPSSMPSYAPAYISYGPFFKLPPGIKLENPVYVAPATAASQSQQYHNHKFPGLKHMDTPLLDNPKKPFGFNDHFEDDHHHDHPVHDHPPHDHSPHDHSHHDHPPHHHPDDIHPHHHDHSHHHHHSPNSIDHHSHHHENHFTHNHHKKRRPPLNKHIQFRRPSPPVREPEHHHHHDHDDIRPPHHHHEDSPHNHHAHHSHEAPAYHDETHHEHHHHHHHPHENDYSNNHQSHNHQHENHPSHRPLDTPSIPNPGFSDSPPPSFYNRDNSFNNEGPLSQHHDSPNLPGYGTPEAAKNYEPPMNFGHPMHNFGPPMSNFGQPPPTFGPPSPPENSPNSLRDGYLPGLPKDIIVGKPPGFNSHPSSHQEQQNHLHGSAPNKDFLPQNFFDTPNKHLESSSNSFDNKGGQRPGEILNQNHHNSHPPKMSGIREEDKYYYNHDSDQGHKSTPSAPLIAYEENNPFNGKEFDFTPSKSIDPFPPRAPMRPPPRFNTNYNSPGMSKDNKVTDWFHFAKRNRQEKILMGYPLEEKRKSTKFSTLPEPFRPFNPDPRHRHIPKLTYDNMSKRVAYRRRPGAGKRPRHRDLLTKDTEDVPLNSNPSNEDEQQEQHEQQQNDLNPHEEEFNNVVNAETEIAETHSADGEEPMTLKSERGFQEMIKAHMKMME